MISPKKCSNLEYFFPMNDFIRHTQHTQQNNTKMMKECRCKLNCSNRFTLFMRTHTYAYTQTTCTFSQVFDILKKTKKNQIDKKNRKKTQKSIFDNKKKLTTIKKKKMKKISNFRINLYNRIIQNITILNYLRIKLKY